MERETCFEFETLGACKKNPDPGDCFYSGAFPYTCTQRTELYTGIHDMDRISHSRHDCHNGFVKCVHRQHSATFEGLLNLFTRDILWFNPWPWFFKLPEKLIGKGHKYY